MKKFAMFLVLSCVFLSMIAQSDDNSQLLREDWTPTWVAQDEENALWIDGAQYVPLVFPWAMKAVGQPTRSGWGRMAVSQGFGVVAMAGSVELLKRTVADTRPNAIDDRSFPSGHTAWAFLGATMIERELGWRSPWYTFGGYTFATAMAMQRVIDSRHFPVDVAGGALIGVAAGHLGYFIGDKIFGTRQLDNKYLTFSGEDNNSAFLSLETGMGFDFAKYEMNGYKISREPSLNVGLKYSMPFVDKWGVALALKMRSTPIFFESQSCERTFVAPENAVGVELAPYFRTQLSSRFSINGEIACGYYRNFSLKSIDKSIGVDEDCVNGIMTMGVAYRMNEKMSLGASLGYEIGDVEYMLRPNSICGIETPCSIKATSHSLLLNLSTRVMF